MVHINDWTKVGDYYYYNYRIAPGEETSSFLESVTFNAKTKLDGKEIEKDGKSLKVIDIYKFVEKMRENGISLEDSLVISCIFNRYQVSENSEDINIDALLIDLEKKQIIL